MSNVSHLYGFDPKEFLSTPHVKRALTDAMLADEQIRKKVKEWDDVQQRILLQYQSTLTASVNFIEESATIYRRVQEQLLQEQERLSRAEALSVQIPERLREPLVAMANRGWYLDDEMSLEPVLSVTMYIEEDPENVDEQFCTYFRDRLDRIEEELIADFPDRKALFVDAFRACREQRYNLSIPVLLAQADGMWQQRHSRNLFGKGGPRKAAKRYENLIKSEDGSEYGTWMALWPLFESAPLWQTQSQRRQHSSAMNRHQILHGESVDYGTETNALKAVSFLSYVRSLLARAKREID